MSLPCFRSSIFILAAGLLLLSGCRALVADRDAEGTALPLTEIGVGNTRTAGAESSAGVTPGVYPGPAMQPDISPGAPTSWSQIIPLGTPAYPGAVETPLPLPSTYPGADITLIPLLPLPSVGTTPSPDEQLPTTTPVPPEETVPVVVTPSPTLVEFTISPKSSSSPGTGTTPSGTSVGLAAARTETNSLAATISPSPGASQTPIIPTATTGSTPSLTPEPVQSVTLEPVQSATPGPTQTSAAGSTQPAEPTVSATVLTQTVVSGATVTTRVQPTITPGQTQLGGSGATLTLPAISTLPIGIGGTPTVSTGYPPAGVQTNVPATATPVIRPTVPGMQTDTPQPPAASTPPEGLAAPVAPSGQFSMQSSGRPSTVPVGPSPAVTPSDVIQPTQESGQAPEKLFTPAPGPVQTVAQLGVLTGRYNMGSSGSTTVGTGPEVIPSPELSITPHLETTQAMNLSETPAVELSPTLELPTITPMPPTATPYLTPTPTITPTPTLTPTPLPAPPWIYTRLPAADPRKVVLAAGKPQLVMFFAYWSGPSQAMSPVIQGLESEYQGRAIFTYLDIDDPATSDLQRRLGFRMEPHFFLLDAQGKILYQWTGSVGL